MRHNTKLHVKHPLHIFRSNMITISRRTLLLVSSRLGGIFQCLGLEAERLGSHLGYQGLADGRWLILLYTSVMNKNTELLELEIKQYVWRNALITD